MFLFEKRAFLPACGPLPYASCLHLETIYTWLPGKRHHRVVLLLVYWLSR